MYHPHHRNSSMVTPLNFDYYRELTECRAESLFDCNHLSSLSVSIKVNRTESYSFSTCHRQQFILYGCIFPILTVHYRARQPRDIRSTMSTRRHRAVTPDVRPRPFIFVLFFFFFSIHKRHESASRTLTGLWRY